MRENDIKTILIGDHLVYLKVQSTTFISLEIMESDIMLQYPMNVR